MKRNIYILCFILLGIMLGFVLHAVIEIGVIELLVSNWDKYSLGLSFSQLMSIHWIFLALLVVLGGYWGYSSGKHWWHVLYVLKKYGEPRF